MRRQLSYLSLFCGCGGFDLGFIQNGFKCFGAFDNDPHVIKVHSENIKSPTYLHDLNNLNLPKTDAKEVDVVIAGSPCQGFSTIGKRDVNDPRNKLLLTGGEIAVKYNAKVFVCENVIGSNSGEHRKYWELLQTQLENRGYNHSLVKYDASDFGVPQARKRLILYAWKGGNVDLELPVSTKKTRLKDVFLNIENVHNHNLNYIPAETSEFLIAERIRPGQKLSDVRGGSRSVHTWEIPEVFGLVTSEEKTLLEFIMKARRQIRRREFGDADPVDLKIIRKRFKNSTNLINSLLSKNYLKKVDTKYIDLKSGFNGKFRRLNINDLSPTVDTRFGDYKYFLHPSENRSISIRESARIQGFPDSFTFSGPIQKQYSMIGNAVPPPLSDHIAKTVRSIIKQL